MNELTRELYETLCKLHDSMRDADTFDDVLDTMEESREVIKKAQRQGIETIPYQA